MESQRYPNSTVDLFNCIQEASNYIRENLGEPEMVIVLGTGLGNFHVKLEDKKTISYADIPHMPKPKAHVIGHAGKLYFGTINGIKLLCWGGRLHAYEDFESYEVSFIADVTAHLGAHTFLITNAAGGAIPEMSDEGCVLMITDHINSTGRNPLDSYYHTFFNEPDLTPTYDTDIAQISVEEAKKLDIQTFTGTYCWYPGPTYETPLEIREFVKLGANLFGMSTVPEVMAAQSHRMRTVICSVITNLAAGITKRVLTGDHVVDVAKKAAEKVEALFEALVNRFKGMPRLHPQECTMELLKAQCNYLHADTFIPTEQQLSEAETFLRSLLGTAEVTDLLVYNGEELPPVTNRRQQFLAQLPGIPTNSVAVREGLLIVGALPGQPVAVILQFPKSCGVNFPIANFVLKAMARIGVNSLRYYIPSDDVRDKVGINDYVQFTNQACIEEVEQVTPLTPVGDALVLAWPGPTKPTRAEIDMTRRLELTNHSNADFAILNVASRLGFASAAYLYNPSALGRSITFEPLETKVVKVPSAVADVPHEPIEIDIENLAPLAAELKAAHDPKLTFLVGHEFSYLVGLFAPTKSYSFGVINIHFGSDIMIVENTRLQFAGEAQSHTTVPIRLSNAMGIMKLVVLETCVGREESGVFYTLKDHCSFAGLNPHRGHNVAEYGDRFCNQTDNYRPEVYNPAIEFFQSTLDLPLNLVNAMFPASARPEVYGPAMGNVCRLMDCDIICQRGIPACIMARHRKTAVDEARLILPVFYAASSCKSQDYVAPPDLSRFKELVEATINA